MKGLFYKEWCLGRKTFFSFLALSFVFCILGVLVFLSMICGNLQAMPKEDPESVKLFRTIFFYVPYILLLFGVEGCHQSIYRDYESGWMTYSYTLPVTAYKAVGARYLMGGSILGIGFLYGLLNAVIISKLSKIAFSFEIVKNLILILIIAIIIFSLFLPLAMKLKKSRTVATIESVLMVGIYLSFGFLMIQYEKKYGDAVFSILSEVFEKIRDIIVLLSPLIIFAAAGISFFTAVKIYQRREMGC